VTNGLEHRECAEALGAYALGALPDSEAARVERHLSECHECRAELDWLRGGVEVLPASVPPVEPPPELKSRLMAIVESEAELLRAAGPAADQPVSPPPPSRWRRMLRGRWLPAFAGAACIAVLAIVLAITAGGPATRTIPAELTPALSGRVQASLEVSGSSAKLVVRGLPVPAANHIYELWVQRGAAPPAPAGTFIVHSGSVQLGRPVKTGDLVLVTVEPGRGTSAPTTTPLLSAKV
jgi:anti-sigma-K factor RskA